MLRLPLVSKTQATLSPFFVATRSEGNGELRTCSRVKPLPRAKEATKMTTSGSKASWIFCERFMITPGESRSWKTGMAYMGCERECQGERFRGGMACGGGLLLISSKFLFSIFYFLFSIFYFLFSIF